MESVSHNYYFIGKRFGNFLPCIGGGRASSLTKIAAGDRPKKSVDHDPLLQTLPGDPLSSVLHVSTRQQCWKSEGGGRLWRLPPRGQRQVPAGDLHPRAQVRRGAKQAPGREGFLVREKTLKLFLQIGERTFVFDTNKKGADDPVRLGHGGVPHLQGP